MAQALAGLVSAGLYRAPGCGDDRLMISKQSGWQPGPPQLTTLPGQVDVWRFPIDREGTLTATARQQAASTVRTILARYLGITQDQVQWRPAPGGKPQLASPASKLQFNLSHCVDLGLLVVADNVAVGVDVERVRALRDPLRLAARVFGESDLIKLRAAGEPARAALFLDLWTQLEARQKTLGRGIFAAPVAYDEVRSMPLHPTDHHVGCVCVRQDGQESDLRLFDFRVD